MTRQRTTVTQRSFLTLDQLPLFADDQDLAYGVVGPDLDKIRHWLASLPTLEAQGLPKRHPVYGRYVPAVRQFYECWHGIVPSSVSATAERERERPWHTPRGGRPTKPVAKETDDEIVAKLDNQPAPKRKGRRLD